MFFLITFHFIRVSFDLIWFSFKRNLDVLSYQEFQNIMIEMKQNMINFIQLISNIFSFTY